MQERIPWAIGFWREPDIPDHRFRHPIAFVDSEWDLAERRLVAHHLRSAKRADSCLGYSWCRFHCGVDDAEMGDSDFSDGLWLWPEGLAHYVLEHAVRLPEEFLRHVRHEAQHPSRNTSCLGLTRSSATTTSGLLGVTSTPIRSLVSESSRSPRPSLPTYVRHGARKELE